MLKDLRHAVRMLLHAKGWTAVVLVSLALGIGANTTLFSAVSGLLLRTVPVSHPETLVRLRWSGPNDMVRSTSGYGDNGKTAAGQDVGETVSYAVYQALQEANATLTGILACVPQGNFNVIVDGQADLASAVLASGNYFSVLGVPASAGRVLTPDDDRPSAPAVVVLSHGYWVRRFGSDPHAIGKVIRVNNVPVTIVGVTPPDFTGIQSLSSPARDVTLPLALDSAVNPPAPGGIPRLSAPTTWWLQMMGRLKPGVTPERVRANLETVFQNTTRDGWSSYFSALTPAKQALSDNQNKGRVPRLEVDSGRRGVYDLDVSTQRSATILAVVVILVLLIVCANVANLLLSRAAARSREIAVRLSMGATRGRLVRQLLTESVVLASLGGMLGVLVAYWSRPLMPFGQTAPLDWRVFGFVTGLSVLTGVAFGLIPALRATRVDLSASMKDQSRSVSQSRTLLSKGLIVVQVSISLVLLIAAGLFLRTLQNLRQVDVGFNPKNLVLFSVNPRLNGYDPVRTATLYADIRQALGTVPGVRSVSLSQSALLAGSISTSRMFIQGKAVAGAQGLRIWVMSVSPEFFETMEIPLMRGRRFDARDTQPKAPAVAVINESAARQYFPGEDPLGRRYGGSVEQPGDVEIVGILRDTKYSSVRDAAPPTAYTPFSEQSTRGATFEVRMAGDPAAAIPAVRDAVRRVDATLPLMRVSTQAEQVENRFTQERLFATSYALFGALALVLASVGLFGLMSYSVARRTPEIGIRMALGAQRGTVVRMVLVESVTLVGIGIAIGIATALAAGRLVTTLLYGLAPTDTVTAALAIVTMVAVSTIAGYLPARRASKVDPLVALRFE